MGAFLEGRLEFREGNRLIDETPRQRPLSLHPFAEAREDIGEVAPDLPLVDDTGETTGAGKHGEQRHFREGDRGGRVVHEEDLVTGERKFVSAARAGPAYRRDGLEPGVLRCILDIEPRLVRVFAEVHLERVGRASQHIDVGARAEDPVLGAADDEAAHLGMLEAEPLDRVGEFDVDTEVVGVGLKDVALAHRPVFLDVHEEARHRRLNDQFPVNVPGRMRLECDDRLFSALKFSHTAHEDRRPIRPESSSIVPSSCSDVQYNADAP